VVEACGIHLKCFRITIFLNTVDKEVHHTSDIHEPTYLLASPLCICWQTKYHCCWCVRFWLGKCRSVVL